MALESPTLKQVILSLRMNIAATVAPLSSVFMSDYNNYWFVFCIDK